MRNLIEELPEQISLTITKQDLIEFADYLIKEYASLQRTESALEHDLKKAIDINEVAAYTGFSRSYIYKLTSGGLIPHYKRGKRLYFKTKELEEWLTENRGFNLADIEKQASDYIMRNPRRF
ncbi:helix-turn-helix domain-containing protein [Saccharicrinis sp. 156]|uniref:helix-turn-helix domain-containing protein n=1 Tax=Saccharicrinis sp. 156 TaxID=3417574 RepID=UPI003D358944